MRQKKIGPGKSTGTGTEKLLPLLENSWELPVIVGEYSDNIDPEDDDDDKGRRLQKKKRENVVIFPKSGTPSLPPVWE